MSEAKVLSFQDALRAREPGRPPVLDLEVLRSRQGMLAIADCHAALDGVAVTKKLKTKEIEYFHGLSVAFPRDRKIALLGHRDSGQRQIQDLLTQRLAPSIGNVVINSRVSWIIPEARFFETRGSLRENAIFFSRIIGIDPRQLLDMFLSIAQLPPGAAHEPVKNLPSWVTKRIGLVVLLYCDFDLHLVGRFSTRTMQMKEDDAKEVLNLVLGRDYVAACDDGKSIPENCNLLYLLYEGVLYQFDDVSQGIEVFDTLPKPVEGPRAAKDREDEDEEDEELREEYF